MTMAPPFGLPPATLDKLSSVFARHNAIDAVLIYGSRAKGSFPIDTTYYVKQTNPAASDITYLYWLLKTLNLPDLRGGAGIPGLNRSDVYKTHQIPLPPLEVQEEIVAEIEGYQKVINGARAVLDHYRPTSLSTPTGRWRRSERSALSFAEVRHARRATQSSLEVPCPGSWSQTSPATECMRLLESTHSPKKAQQRVGP